MGASGWVGGGEESGVRREEMYILKAASFGHLSLLSALLSTSC